MFSHLHLVKRNPHCHFPPTLPSCEEDRQRTTFHMFKKVSPKRPCSLRLGVPCSCAGGDSQCLSGRLAQMNLFLPFAAFPAQRGEEPSGRVQWKAWQQSLGLGKRTQSASWEKTPQVRDYKAQSQPVTERNTFTGSGFNTLFLLHPGIRNEICCP